MDHQPIINFLRISPILNVSLHCGQNFSTVCLRDNNFSVVKNLRLFNKYQVWMI